MKAASLLTALGMILLWSTVAVAQKDWSPPASRRIGWQDVEASFHTYFVPQGFNPKLLWKKSDPKNADSLRVIDRIQHLVNRWIELRSYYYWNDLLNIEIQSYVDYAEQYLETCEGCERSMWKDAEQRDARVHPGEYLGCFLRDRMRSAGKMPVPEFFKLYAVIESGLNPVALDKNADGKLRDIRYEKGLWQMYQRTAIDGAALTVNRTVDERLNPVLSTDGAVRFFNRLHAIQGDWEPVIAIYNQGQKRVDEFRAAVEKRKRRTIPREDLLLGIWDEMTPTTRNVYEYFVALVLFMHEYGHGCARPVESIQLQTDTAGFHVRTITDLRDVFDVFENRF